MTVRALPALGGAALLILLAHAACALPALSHQRAEAFATCAGRYQAMATRQSATRAPAAGETRRMAETFEALLDATLPAAWEAGVPPGQADHWRWAGWGEMAGLLAEIDQSFDAARAERARRRAAERLAECARMVL